MRSMALLARLDEGRRVTLGSEVVLDDLDDGTREEYVLVDPSESNPAKGRLSSESPLGRAITGRRRGDVVDVRAPSRIRHVRVSAVRGRGLAASACGFL